MSGSRLKSVNEDRVHVGTAFRRCDLEPAVEITGQLGHEIDPLIALIHVTSLPARSLAPLGFAGLLT